MPNRNAATSPGSIRHHSYVQRPRASYSCHCCRARRVKCDKAHPECGRCLKDGETCTYSQLASSGASHAAVGLPISKRRKISHRISKTALNIPATPCKPFPESGSLGAGRDSIPGLGFLSQKDGRSRYVGRTFWAYVDDDNLELETLLQDQNRCIRPEHENGHFQASDDSSLPDQSRHDGIRPAEEVQSNPFQALWQENLPSNRIISPTRRPTGQDTTTLPKLLEDLPPREACDVLYRCFIVSVHAISPLLHIPSFNEDYARFWTWIENRDRKGLPTGILAENPSFLPLLFAVLFGGAVSCSNKVLTSQFKFASRSVISSKLCSAAMRTQNLVSFPQNPTIYSLTSFLIVHNLLAREEEPFASCSYISLALRVAQVMGLHRDGSLFGLPLVETEIRRRIWWHIIHTDVMTSIPSALPPSCLSDTIYDAKMTSEFKDGHIEMAVEDAVSDRQTIYASPVLNFLDVRLMVAVDRYSITSVLRSILRRQFDIEPMSNSDLAGLKDAVDSLSCRIEARIDQLCRIGRLKNPSSASAPRISDQRTEISEVDFDEHAFLKWAPLLLRLMVHKSYCVLYQPLVRESNHPIWAKVRMDCIHHCQEFMQIYIAMCSSDPFRPYHWLYPGLYQPLHVAAVLLSDLLKFPKSAEAERSMTLIDKMFSLISLNDGIVSEDNGVIVKRHLQEGGQAAWALVRRLRRKAWLRHGRDPDILWTEDAWNTSTAADTANTHVDQTSRVEPSSSSFPFQPPSAETFEAPLNLVGSYSDVPLECAEQSEYVVDSDTTDFNWSEWEAAMMGNFSLYST